MSSIGHMTISRPGLATRSGTGLLSIPYSQEINDIPAIIGRKQEGTTFAGMIADAVEQLLGECDRRPLVLGIALHPYVMARPIVRCTSTGY